MTIFYFYRIVPWWPCSYLFLKFIYSEKATNFYEISSIDLSFVVKVGCYVVMVKSAVEISQNFVAFSEYMNFRNKSKTLYFCLPLQILWPSDTSGASPYFSPSDYDYLSSICDMIQFFFRDLSVIYQTLLTWKIQTAILIQYWVRVFISYKTLRFVFARLFLHF